MHWLHRLLILLLVIMWAQVFLLRRVNAVTERAAYEFSAQTNETKTGLVGEDIHKLIKKINP